jgi:hypothetical protein
MTAEELLSEIVKRLDSRLNILKPHFQLLEVTFDGTGNLSMLYLFTFVF